MTIFHHAHPKVIESTFNFPETAPACKISLFHLFILQIQSILESHHHILIMSSFMISFSKKFDSVTHNFIRVSSTMPKFRKSKNPIPTSPRKHQDRRQDGWTDRPYFIAPFQLPPGIQPVKLQ